MPIAELTDVDCYYQLSGKGEAVVLIPGLGSTSQIWAPIRPELEKHFCVISIDNRDIGQSVAKRHPRKMRDYGADLVELLDHLQVARAHLLGLSLGGGIAQRFAVDHPQRVSRLVLVSCAHEFGPYLREMARLVGQTRRWCPTSVYARMMEVLGTGPLYLDADPDKIEQKIRELREARVPGKAVIRQLRALGASRFEPGEYRIRAETLVVSGEFDALIPHCYARRMAELIEHSHYILLPDAGHNPFTDCPDRVLPMVVEFLHSGRVTSVDDLQPQRGIVQSDQVSKLRPSAA